MNQLLTEVREVADEVYTGRVIRDGMVAVLFSPGFGAGWSTWSGDYGDEMLFDPWIVDIIMSDSYNKDEKTQRILAHCAVKYPDLYTGGVEQLTVEWIPQGTAFRITDYDGNESIEYRDMTDWTIA